VRYKTIYLPFYKDGAYSVSGLWILLGREKPSIKEEFEETFKVNPAFLKKIIKKENQMNNFTKTFYDTTLSLPYANSHKICKIRELDTAQKEEQEK